MCTSKPKQPEIKERPTPAPRPTIEPSESSPTGQQDQRRKRIQDYRRGFASTIKTSPLGATDQQGAKQLLGR